MPTVSGNGTSTSADATWIGIGGVTTSDLIQVGTQDTVSSTGQVSTSGFYEMLPNVSQPVPGVTVSAGDSMSASLVETSPGEWTITLTDLTNSETFTDHVSYSSTNSSAEWIEEDPSYASGQLVPFDNFGTVDFSTGITTVNGTSLSIYKAGGDEIIMEQSGQDVATPSALDTSGEGFSVTHN